MYVSLTTLENLRPPVSPDTLLTSTTWALAKEGVSFCEIEARRRDARELDGPTGVIQERVKDGSGKDLRPTRPSNITQGTVDDCRGRLAQGGLQTVFCTQYFA